MNFKIEVGRSVRIKYHFKNILFQVLLARIKGGAGALCCGERALLFGACGSLFN